ncbi:hypothetical protein H6G80_13630 [Nostoc sp. FACHB-87]|nr:MULTISPECIES: hypothetical protein [Nostocales]MBD2300872.1 hypothetical protein [Nostoc sp. FACHB-190]MBD2455123.1 hypothetical protein [Nostoc sp. FACHB-87]MBD2477869.1 hypothetical protein [Anabaena sp. FACHB-83]MBD2487282.1 hypothetical protein [Aulosira sp. FACHB-615]
MTRFIEQHELLEDVAMLPDNILEEIHKNPKDHTKSCNCDLDAMFAD